MPVVRRPHWRYKVKPCKLNGFPWQNIIWQPSCTAPNVLWGLDTTVSKQLERLSRNNTKCQFLSFKPNLPFPLTHLHATMKGYDLSASIHTVLSDFPPWLQTVLLEFISKLHTSSILVSVPPTVMCLASRLFETGSSETYEPTLSQTIVSPATDPS